MVLLSKFLDEHVLKVIKVRRGDVPAIKILPGCSRILVGDISKRLCTSSQETCNLLCGRWVLSGILVKISFSLSKIFMKFNRFYWSELITDTSPESISTSTCVYFTVFVFNSGKCDPRVDERSKIKKKCATRIRLTSSFTSNGRMRVSGADCLAIVSVAVLFSARTTVECLACFNVQCTQCIEFKGSLRAMILFFLSNPYQMILLMITHNSLSHFKLRRVLQTLRTRRTYKIIILTSLAHT